MTYPTWAAKFLLQFPIHAVVQQTDLSSLSLCDILSCKYFTVQMLFARHPYFASLLTILKTFYSATDVKVLYYWNTVRSSVSNNT